MLFIKSESLFPFILIRYFLRTLKRPYYFCLFLPIYYKNQARAIIYIY